MLYITLFCFRSTGSTVGMFVTEKDLVTSAVIMVDVAVVRLGKKVSFNLELVRNCVS